MEIEWRTCVNAPRYEVSNTGEVRNRKTGNILACPPSEKGYRHWKAYQDDGTHPTLYTHKEVAYAFLGPRPVGEQVRHRDGNSLNNNLTNLKYGTPKKNGEDRVLHGTSGQGSSHPKSVLSDDDVLKIRSLFASGKTMKELIGLFGHPYGTVYSALVGKTYTYLDNAQKIVDYDHNEIIDFIKQGYSLTAISEYTGMTPKGITYVWEQHSGTTIREYRKTHKVRFGAKIPK